MDYHFLRPEGVAPQGGLSSRRTVKILLKFLPVFVLAAVLPFLIGLVVTPSNIGFFTRADTEPELRVWLEPANILMSSGSTAELTLVAQFDAESLLIPEIALELSSRGGVVMDNTKFVHSIPFRGRKEIGKVYIRGVSPGNAEVIIPQESVAITAFEGPLIVTTAKANVIVEP